MMKKTISTFGVAVVLFTVDCQSRDKKDYKNAQNGS
jgi:hypothetical protein